MPLVNSIDPKAWQYVGNVATHLFAGDGGDDPASGTVPTKVQTVSATFILEAYKFVMAGGASDADYYLLYGEFGHGIQNSPADPSANWLSVGFYSTHQYLTITCTTPGAIVTEFGPNSTVGSHTVSFSIGASAGAKVGGGKPGEVSGGVSASVGVSFTAPDVRYAVRPARNSVVWQVALPGVGADGPGIPANPLEASYAGQWWQPMLVVSVAKNAPLVVDASMEIDFCYDYTRGIRYRTLYATGSWTGLKPAASQAAATEPMVVVPGDARPPIEPPAETRSYTVVELMRALSSTPDARGLADSFLASMRFTQMADEFSVTDLRYVVACPENGALVSWLAENPVRGVTLSGPGSYRPLYDFDADRVQRLAPGADTRAVDELLRSLAQRFDCKDGVLWVLRQVDVPPQLAALVDEANAKALAPRALTPA